MSPRNRDASTGRGRGQPRMLNLMTQTTPPAVALDNVHKHFGAVRAVDGITLTINPGEVVAFLGPNGAGKTTTIDMMLGLGKPSSGTVTVFGNTPEHAISSGRISAVMQTGGLLRDLSVVETLKLTRSLFSHTRAVDEVLERGDHRYRGPPRRQVLRRRAAAPAFRHGAAARPGPARAG